jgi:hypothetical protein
MIETLSFTLWYLPFYTAGFSVRPQYTGIPHLYLVPEKWSAK